MNEVLVTKLSKNRPKESLNASTKRECQNDINGHKTKVSCMLTRHLNTIKSSYFTQNIHASKFAGMHVFVSVVTLMYPSVTLIRSYIDVILILRF